MKSAAKILSILELLCVEGQAGITEISHKLGLSKSTIHRSLVILKQLGYAKNEVSNGKYAPTLKLFTIGSMVKDRMTLVDIARIHMQELERKTHATINLAVFTGHVITYIDKVERKPLIPLGRRTPAYATAPGKVFLAYLSPTELQEYLRDTKLTACTSNTITSVDELNKELKRIREQGFAIDCREADYSFQCVAAPIFEGSQNMIAAISIAAPIVDISLKSLRSFIPDLLESTKRISAIMS